MLRSGTPDASEGVAFVSVSDAVGLRGGSDLTKSGTRGRI